MEQNGLHVHVRVGQFEFEYEGPRENLSVTFFSKVEELFEKAASSTKVDFDAATNINGSTDQEDELLSTNDIAVRLGAKTSQDLALAALYRLSGGQPDKHFPRRSILSEMKKATSIFEKRHENGLTSALRSLANKSKIRILDQNSYALTADYARELRDHVANN